MNRFPTQGHADYPQTRTRFQASAPPESEVMPAYPRISAQHPQGFAVAGPPATPINLANLTITDEERRSAEKEWKKLFPNYNELPPEAFAPMEKLWDEILFDLTPEQKELVINEVENQDHSVPSCPILNGLIRKIPVWLPGSTHPMDLKSLNTWFKRDKRAPDTNLNFSGKVGKNKLGRECIREYANKRNKYNQLVKAALIKAKMQLGFGAPFSQTARTHQNNYVPNNYVPNNYAPNNYASMQSHATAPTHSARPVDARGLYSHQAYSHQAYSHQPYSNELRTPTSNGNQWNFESIHPNPRVEQLRSVLPSFPVKAIEFLFDKIKDFDVIVLIDKNQTNQNTPSGHYQNRGQAMTNTIKEIVKIMACIDDDGIEIVGINNALVKVFNNVTNPNSRYLQRFLTEEGRGHEKLKKGVQEVTELARDKSKPVLLYIITAGGWKDQQFTDGVLRNLMESFVPSGDPEFNRVGFLTHYLDEGEQKIVDDLDDDPDSFFKDFIDATGTYEEEYPQVQRAFQQKGMNYQFTREMHLMKKLLGPVMPEWDRFDETSHTSSAHAQTDARFIKEMLSLFPS